MRLFAVVQFVAVGLVLLCVTGYDENKAPPVYTEEYYWENVKQGTESDNQIDEAFERLPWCQTVANDDVNVEAVFQRFFAAAKGKNDTEWIITRSIMLLTALGSKFIRDSDNLSALGTFQMALELTRYSRINVRLNKYMNRPLASLYSGLSNIYEDVQGTTHFSQYFARASAFYDNCKRRIQRPELSPKTLMVRKSNAKIVQSPSKLIGLMHVKNVAAVIKHTLPLFSKIVDGLIVLDNNSTDGTYHKLMEMKVSCKILSILNLSNDEELQELYMKQILLQEGRKHHGTHFMLIDGDEILSYNLLKDGLIRSMVSQLQPLEMITVPWVHAWQSSSYFRLENSFRYNVLNRRQCIAWADHPSLKFCEPGKCFPRIHIPRCPMVQNVGRVVHFGGMSKVLIHLRFLEDLDGILIKQAWYMMKEKVMNPNKDDEKIRVFYREDLVVTKDNIQPVPRKWYLGYGRDLLKALERAYQPADYWREREILLMNVSHPGLFSKLDVGRMIEKAHQRVNNHESFKFKKPNVYHKMMLSSLDGVYCWSFITKSNPHSIVLSKLYSTLVAPFQSLNPSLSMDFRVLARVTSRFEQENTAQELADKR